MRTLRTYPPGVLILMTASLGLGVVGIVVGNWWIPVGQSFLLVSQAVGQRGRKRRTERQPNGAEEPYIELWRREESWREFNRKR